jgi:hypothetical protein
MIVAFFRNHLKILLVLPEDSALESSYSSRIIYSSARELIFEDAPVSSPRIDQTHYL